MAKYMASPTSVETSRSKQKQTLCITVWFRTDDERNMPADLYVTEKTVERVEASLRACGWTGSDLGDVQIDPNARVELVTEIEEYNGNKRERVQWINVPRAGGSASPEDDVRAALRAFNSRLKSGAAASNGAAKHQAPPSGDFGPEGDIPF